MVKDDRYFLPAEWQKQECVQVAWPDASTDWRAYLSASQQMMVALIEVISRYEGVLVVAQDIASARQQIAAGLSAEQRQRQRVTIVPCPLNDTWVRDYGGLTLLSANTGQRQILDFAFNGWGGKYPAEKDTAVTRQLHARGILQGTLVDNNDFILEGGSIESDGKGTVLTTTSCLLSTRRNRLSQHEIEAELKRRLHVARVLWLHHGQLLGDDTDGHIDTLVRFCPSDTLVVTTAEANDEHYPALQALAEEVQTLTTIDGKPYTLLPLPLPAPVTFEGERLPATYANFLVINGAVIVPTYQQSDRDSEAQHILRRAFPTRDIIALDATVAVRQHGSIHCLTMQYPLGE